MNAISHATPPSVNLPAIYLREAWFELLRSWRTPAFSLPTLAFPLVFYVMFAVVLPGQWSGVQKSAYLLATYGTFGVMGPALFGFGVGLALAYFDHGDVDVDAGVRRGVIERLVDAEYGQKHQDPGLRH